MRDRGGAELAKPRFYLRDIIQSFATREQPQQSTEEARKAVQRALFKPYLDGGVARAAVALIPVEFSLHGAGRRNG